LKKSDREELERLERAWQDAAKAEHDAIERYNAASKALTVYLLKFRANPCGTQRNPAPAIPSEVAFLGAALELQIKPPEGRSFWMHWDRETPLRHALCAADERTLIVFHVQKPRSTPAKSVPTRLKDLWRLWSGFHVDGALSFSVGASSANVYQGTARNIRYRSDKWEGVDHNYEHKCGAGLHVWADKSTDPRILLISADPPRRLLTERGIVG